MFKGLDHLAIVVDNTEKALKVWRDRFGFPVLFSEVVNEKTILLTHLDMGNMHLQIVEPLKQNHPLQDWLKTNGCGLHHFCLSVDNLDSALERAKRKGIKPGQPKAHQGTRGKRALFLDIASTGKVPVELTEQ